MSNVIRFLESLGSNASLANLTSQDYAELVDGLDVEPTQRAALRERDSEALGDSLGYNGLWCCFIYEDAPADAPAKDDEDEGDRDGGKENESPPSIN